MKLIKILILLLLVGAGAQAQYTSAGAPKAVTRDLGGRVEDSILAFPIRDTVNWTWADFRKMGRVTMRPQDSLIYYHNGQIWKQMGSGGSGPSGPVTVADVIGLQDSLNKKLTIGNFIITEFPSGMINGSNQTFTTTYPPSSGKIEFYWNGILQYYGVGNSFIISGNTITTYFTPSTGDQLQITYIKQ